MGNVPPDDMASDHANCRYKTVPIWAVRLMMGFLRLLSLVWSGAMRYHAIAQVLPQRKLCQRA